ncbi:hypothetical protein FOH10_07385 [Nocardia otitidiscaviarum]|uniref:Uncharacterized protein n=1 Tax=Nocardia otitidiscaviarum TaxID=1823 RepID=A0A516NI93_9NOCA|nr:hypothetical protein [Nocardia otitidiscaviarum]MCP9619928.1 hypothetical protein [Nocardia otitidiscaviarum]QDP78589.1 hypothetical protein FOH10_07385 [Nocardia otitidiscaviarum]
MIHRTLTLVTAASVAVLITAGTAYAAPRTWLNEGTQVVGEDVPAGLYSTAGPNSDDHGYCFIEWLPYKGATSSELIDIEAYEGPSYVQLDDGEVITVDGCTWIHESYTP